jgi:nucleotide exchange factor SIL1
MAGTQLARLFCLPALLAAVLSGALLLCSPAAGAVEKGTNKSSLLGQPRQWATGKDESEILAEAEARGRGGDESVAGDLGREFNSLDGMLQWAIGTAREFGFLII